MEAAQGAFSVADAVDRRSHWSGDDGSGHRPLVSPHAARRSETNAFGSAFLVGNGDACVRSRVDSCNGVSVGGTLASFHRRVLAIAPVVLRPLRWGTDTES